MIRFFAAVIFSMIIIVLALFLFGLQISNYDFSFENEKNFFEEFEKTLEDFSTSTPNP